MRMKLPREILDAEWIKGNGFPLIRYADENKKIRIVPAGMHPYFFIKQADLGEAIKYFKNRVVNIERGNFVTITGHKAVKISARYPSDISNDKRTGLRDILEKNGIETFESDIPFVKRWMIDNDIRQVPITEKAYMDIEVDAREGFPEPDKAPFRVLCISVSGSDGKKYFFCDKDEKKMLKSFLRLIRSKYHMLTGWNIKKFDWPYLVNRITRQLKMRMGFIPIQEIDAMLNYTKLTLWGFIGKSYRLEAVAKTYLGVDHECLWGEVPVLTNKGFIPIKEIPDSFFTGFKECYLVKIGGYYIIGSGDHPLLSEEGYWVPIKKLRPGDKVIRLNISWINNKMNQDAVKKYHEKMQSLWEAFASRENILLDSLYDGGSLEKSRISEASKGALEWEKKSEAKPDTKGKTFRYELSTGNPKSNESHRKRGKRISRNSRGTKLQIQETGTSGTLGKEGWSCGFYCGRSNSNRSIQLDGLEICLQPYSSPEENCSITETRVLSVPIFTGGHFRAQRLCEESFGVSVVEDIKYVGILPTYNLEEPINHNYILVGGVISHNSMKNKMDAERLWKSFISDRKELREYNMEDADLVRRLDEKLHLCDPYIELTKMWPIMLRDTPFMSSVIDVMLLQEAIRHKWRFVFPRRKEHEAELLGGMTLRPIQGVHRGVISLDFKSLYPTIIITFGLSPELMYLFQAWRYSGKLLGEWIKDLFGVECEDSTTPPSIPPEIPKDSSPEEKYEHWKTYFKPQVKYYIHFARTLMKLGITPYPFMAKHLRDLLELRAKIKKEMKQYPEESLEFMAKNISQAAVKLVLVSSYGVTGYRNTRFFNAEFVNHTTGLGQTILETVTQIAKMFGFHIIYGDTDSVFLKPMMQISLFRLTLLAPTIANLINEELKKKLIKEFGLRPEDYIITLEPKNVYHSILFSKAKKKYLGKTVWIEGLYENKREVVGFEEKRSDAFELMAEVQKNIHEILSTYEMEQVDEAIEQYLTEVAADLFKGKYDDKLILEMSVRKISLDSYESEDPHVRVARKLKEMNMFRPGDKVRWIVIDEKQEEPVVEGYPLPKPTFRGYMYYFNRLMNMVERMLGYRPGITISPRGKIMKQLSWDQYV